MQYVSIFDEIGVETERIKKMDFWKDSKGFLLNEEIIKSQESLIEQLHDTRPNILLLVKNSQDRGFFTKLFEITTTMKDIKIIVHGNDDSYNNVRECFINGVFDYLVQPVDSEQLEKSLLRVYSTHGIEYVMDTLQHKTDALIDNIFLGGGQEDVIIESIINQIYEDWNNDSINCQNVSDKAKKYIYETLIERKPWLEKFLYKTDFDYHFGFTIKTKEKIIEEWIRCFKEASIMVKKYQMIDDKLVYAIGKYVVVHVDEHLSLEKVANGVFLNPSYVSHIFKKVTGMSFVDYMAEVKIDRAKVLMRDSNIKICEVANRVGYNNPEYFTRNFKKKTGYTSIEYKKKLEEKYKLV